MRTPYLPICLLMLMQGRDFLITAAAQRAQTPAAAAQTYTHPDYHYMLTVPGNWKRSQVSSSAGNVILFTAPKDGNFTPNFLVTVNSAGGQNLDQYVAEARQAIAKLKTIRIGSDTPSTLDGLPARTLLLRGETPNQHLAFMQRQVYCVRDRRGYVLGATFGPTMAAAYNPQFDKIYRSFKWGR